MRLLNIIFIIFILFVSISHAESYRVSDNGYIKRLSDEAWIPPTMKNPDYVKYIMDKDYGAEVLPYDYAAEEARLNAETTRLEAIEKARKDLEEAKIKEYEDMKLKISEFEDRISTLETKP